MKYQFIKKLLNAPLDIIGDIHGEIEALEKLIDVLGYDENGNHPNHRKLIFVGDLCDRGQDSIAVITLVKKLVENGNAQCILGNHELNLLINSKREGNGWFFGSPHEDDEKIFATVSKQANVSDKKWILDFLNTLPLALESEQLRVVHACWDKAYIEALKACSFDSVSQAYQDYQIQIERYIKQSGLSTKAKEEEDSYPLKNVEAKIPLLNHLAKKDLIEQMHNPIKVVTSGVEYLAPKPFYAGGKWRMVDRLPWWEYYKEYVPVVVGHYWRNFKSSEEKTGLFKCIEPLQWFGAKNNVFCIDYSVGKRYLSRAKKYNFVDQLAALRFPENILMLENGEVFNMEK